MGKSRAWWTSYSTLPSMDWGSGLSEADASHGGDVHFPVTTATPFGCNFEALCLLSRQTLAEILNEPPPPSHLFFSRSIPDDRATTLQPLLPRLARCRRRQR